MSIVTVYFDKSGQEHLRNNKTNLLVHITYCIANKPAELGFVVVTPAALVMVTVASMVSFDGTEQIIDLVLLLD